jgi:4-carboxymuconolactone decarboxylase
MNSWYEWGSHVDRAIKIGIQIDDIHRVLEANTDDHWSVEDAVLLRAVDELTRDHCIASETLAILEQHHSNAQIMDLIAIHGMYLILAGMLKTWGLALDASVLKRIDDLTNETSFHEAALHFSNEFT